ncbi:MAG TPA: hypothetical protein VFP91_00010 [Vicinamibacterales bacterium]|nr:hypothetical protein [Vicinamibacterales bacterium]
MKKTVLVLTVAVCAFATARLYAQWPAFSPPGVPKTADGKIDYKAPAPRTADGKPDLSGVWETAPCPDCAPPVIDGLSPTPGSGQAAARGNAPVAPAAPAAPAGQGGGRGRGGNPFARNVFGNVGGSTPEGEAPYQPWAKELVQKRQADNSKDNPDAHCLPMGIMQMDSHPYPKKVIQTPTEVLMIYEGSGTTVREIFLDGRPLPKKEDVEPWWNGYSVGHWEGDTLVVETTGLMDDGWLDVRGSPLTSAAKLTERIRRINYGYLEIKVTIDDPKAYTKPFDAIVYSRIMPSAQLSEFVCIDKDAAHYIGSQQQSRSPQQQK